MLYLIFRAFVGTLADLPKGSLIDHHHYASPMISPTAHFAHNTAHKGKVIQYNLYLFTARLIWPKITNKTYHYEY